MKITASKHWLFVCFNFLIIILVSSCAIKTTEAPGGRSELLILFDAFSQDRKDETALISRYYGACRITEDLLTYDISMTYNGQETMYHGESPFKIILKLYSFNTNSEIQELTYTPPSHMRPETIRQGLIISDFNNDGNEDFLMDLGAFGHTTRSVCFVYNSKTKDYIVVPGFDELNAPNYCSTSNEGYFLSDMSFVEQPYQGGVEKYIIEDENLVLVARLLNMYCGEGEGYRYTEEHMIGDELIVSKKDVPVTSIDWNAWSK